MNSITMTKADLIVISTGYLWKIWEYHYLQSQTARNAEDDKALLDGFLYYLRGLIQNTHLHLIGVAMRSSSAQKEYDYIVDSTFGISQEEYDDSVEPPYTFFTVGMLKEISPAQGDALVFASSDGGPEYLSSAFAMYKVLADLRYCAMFNVDETSFQLLSCGLSAFVLKVDAEHG